METTNELQRLMDECQKETDIIFEYTYCIPEDKMGYVKIADWKIELADLQFGPLQDDGYSYKANLKINDALCGTIENNGFGGDPDLNLVDDEDVRALVKEVNSYFQKRFSHLQDLSIVCDYLADGLYNEFEGEK